MVRCVGVCVCVYILLYLTTSFEKRNSVCRFKILSRSSDVPPGFIFITISSADCVDSCASGVISFTGNSEL